jgi:hypothetical protein
MMTRLKYGVLLLICCLGSQSSFSQVLEEDLVQFSGIIVTHDSLKPIPFVNVMIKGEARGTVSDIYGFFSFVAKKNDTIEFSSIGFRKTSFVIPDTLKQDRYSLIQIMSQDTVLLKDIFIYPWPTKAQFEDAFLALRVPDDDLERAKKNLEQSKLRELGQHMPMDASQNYKNTMQQQYSKLYYAGGQIPPTNILNPLAWAKFIQAWQNGDFKTSNDY